MAMRPTYDPARTVDRRGAAKLLDLIAGHALEVLTAVARAMPDGSRLILCEAPVPSRNQSYSKLSDINMLLCSRGRERTQAEYRALLFQAGLRMTKAIPTESPTGMMLPEAKP